MRARRSGVVAAQKGAALLRDALEQKTYANIIVAKDVGQILP